MPFKWSFLLQASQSRQTISISIDDLEGMRGQCLSWRLTSEPTRVTYAATVGFSLPTDWCHSRSNVEKFKSDFFWNMHVIFTNLSYSLLGFWPTNWITMRKSNWIVSSKNGDFSQNCLETTTTCDQSLPSLPAKSEDKSPTSSKQGGTLREINISHLGKRKIIFKYALSGGYVNSLEGNLLRIGNQLWVTFLTISSHLHEIYIETTSRFPLPPTVMKLENRTMEVDFCFEDDCFSTDSRLWTEEYLTLQLHPFAKSEDKFFQNGVITMGGS